MLLASVPSLDPRAPRNWTRVQGEIPSPMNPPSGCAFRTRCPRVMDVCSKETPPLQTLPGGSRVACHLYGIPDGESRAHNHDRKD